MVTITNTSAAGIGALGVETRANTRPVLTPLVRDDAARNGADSVQISDAAAWRAAQESVRAGIAQVRTALSIGEEAQALLARVQDLAKSGDADAEEEVKRLAAEFAEKIDAAIRDGAALLKGDALNVQAEPGSAPLSIAGLDLRLKEDAGEDGVIGLGRTDSLADAGEAARASFPGLQSGLVRLAEALRGLEAHQGFLGAAEDAAANVRTDLDADTARLLALQVRQGLDAAGAASIANVEPQAVLSLFRA